jgi:hypothetical protein
MRFVGGHSSPLVRGEAELRGKVNYLMGNDPSLWRTNISTFAKVRCEEVYPGIDLVYYGTDGQLEYDFVLAPGADPNVIALEFDGADEVTLDGRGDLIVRVSGREVRWRMPLVYQQINGGRKEIAGVYRVSARLTEPGSRTFRFVSFEIAAYDPSQPLVIDPTLVYGTFLGGSDNASIGTGKLAVDRTGNAYLTGYTLSAQFPTKNPVQATPLGRLAAFVAKLDSSGQIVYATYVGGSPVGDKGGAIAVDSAGHAYVVGSTLSRDFPTVSAVQPNFGGGTGFGDAFILKLSPDGSALVYSTYLGGKGDDAAFGVAVDSSGNAYVCGSTASENFPTTNAVQPKYGGGGNLLAGDVFIAKMNSTGTALIFSTYLGGSNDDRASAIMLDEQGSAYVGGLTASDDFPTKSPFQPNRAGGNDGFLAKLSPTGDTLVFSSYIGGSAHDQIASIALRPDGDIYLAGPTVSGDFPTANALQPQNNGDQDGFVARYKPASNSLVFSTYLGGSGYDTAGGLVLDAGNDIYVAGFTASTDFPTVDALQPSFAGGSGPYGDAVLSVLSSDGSRLIYSSYLGGSGSEAAWGLSLDHDGNVYLSGQATSTDFPIQNPIVPNPFTGQYSAFVVKFTPIGTTLPALKVIRSGDTLLITWPASVSGAVLESAALLPAPTWTAVLPQPVVIGDQNAVTVDIEGQARFYRLRKP